MVPGQRLQVVPLLIRALSALTTFGHNNFFFGSKAKPIEWNKDGIKMEFILRIANFQFDSLDLGITQFYCSQD